MFISLFRHGIKLDLAGALRYQTFQDSALFSCHSTVGAHKQKNKQTNPKKQKLLLSKANQLLLQLLRMNQYYLVCC